jgi:hypothetical protein
VWDRYYGPWLASNAEEVSTVEHPIKLFQKFLVFFVPRFAAELSHSGASPEQSLKSSRVVAFAFVRHLDGFVAQRGLEAPLSHHTCASCEVPPEPQGGVPSALLLPLLTTSADGQTVTESRDYKTIFLAFFDQSTLDDMQSAGETATWSHFEYVTGAVRRHFIAFAEIMHPFQHPTKFQVFFKQSLAAELALLGGARPQDAEQTANFLVARYTHCVGIYHARERQEEKAPYGSDKVKIEEVEEIDVSALVQVPPPASPIPDLLVSPTFAEAVEFVATARSYGFGAVDQA